MQLDAREDIAAPQEMVWREITNFTGFERSAMRRGMEVRRLNDSDGAGASWALEFKYRGRDRKARCKITDWNPKEHFSAMVVSSGIEARVDVDMVSLSRGRTRLDLTVVLSSQSFAGKLLVQSFKLARGSLDRRLKNRLTGFARDIEDRVPRG